MNGWLQLLRQGVKESQAFSLPEFFEKNPDAASNDFVAVGIIYEYACLRQEANKPVSVQTLKNQFRRWRKYLDTVFEFDKLLNEQDPDDDWRPTAGQEIDSFQLHHELGRGAVGQVFLATQPSLSDRPVVVKFVPLGGSEHRSLAKLQHSSIVPLFFSQLDPSRTWRLLCMPYLGGCTLERLMEDLREIPVRERSGRNIVDSIESRYASEFANHEERGTEQPAIRFLARANYGQAVCWMIACLAEGLHYAHQRGLLHLDVKPSNVLVADDGQPMLLDFHLARELNSLENESLVGGTAAYMSPEQRDSILKQSNGDEPPFSLGPQSDIYSLGLVLFDLLAGVTPMMSCLDEGLIRRDITRGNIQQCTKGIFCDGRDQRLEVEIAKCLNHDPIERHENAGEFARQLRSIAMSDTKQLKPRRFLQGFVSGLLLSAAIGTASYLYLMPQPKQSRTPALAVEELGNLMRQVRSPEFVESLSEDNLVRLESTLAKTWERRHLLLDTASQDLNRAQRQRMLNDLRDLANVYSVVVSRREKLNGPENPIKSNPTELKSQQILDQAKALFGSRIDQ